ncbi:hypothetical protein [Pectinatus cerevisiiphilus]|uniref:Uncharacterized protein n=2 Tax=Pectinatus cerevisiiphilus TaxID=86956 RepID=A0A4R3KE25_9FIRM|nr:hypothetical protein [Pectinatus cerevisiiphilus]TCS81457.1 hypothetical protein EDC37_102162 [Pectinatus cerevisiiphilus]
MVDARTGIGTFGWSAEGFYFCLRDDTWAVQAKYFIGVKGKAFYCAEVFG